MSKAFLRESDIPEAIGAPPRATTLPPGAKNYLTAEGAAILRDRLNEWIAQVRPPLAADPSAGENREELQKLDAKIRRIQESLRTAEVADPAERSGDIVCLGHRVTVREANGELATYRIVGVDETELFPNGISWLSPLAQALLNTRVGEHVSFDAPRGVQKLKIVRIE